VHQHIQLLPARGEVGGKGADAGQTGDVAHLDADIGPGHLGQDLTADLLTALAVEHGHQHRRPQPGQPNAGGFPRSRS